jgi:peptidoglycan/xylan/chitin deacetylase (PgdA/CDA1 family)
VQDWKHHIAGIGLELAYVIGLSRVAERRASGTGVILKFQRVRPRRRGLFQPLKRQEITPEFLDRTIATLKRRGFDIVSIDEACERSRQSAGARRFAVLTFDGGYRDFISHAYPVLRRQDVPFTVYAPTGFIDGVALPWWLVLETVIAQSLRIALIMDGEERRFKSTSAAEKYAVFDVVHRWLCYLPPDDITTVIRDLCTRYRIDLKAISRDVFMTWSDLSALADDPRAGVGSATVNYAVLARMTAAAALREMKMGRSVLESALRRRCPHFAYPFGDAGSFGDRDVHLAQEADFVSAVSSQTGLISTDRASAPLDLPRIVWDGRRSSTRKLQVLTSGLTSRRRRAKEKAED